MYVFLRSGFNTGSEENMVLLSNANREGLGQPAHPRSVISVRQYIFYVHRSAD